MKFDVAAVRRQGARKPVSYVEGTAEEMGMLVGLMLEPQIGAMVRVAQVLACVPVYVV